MKSSDEVLKIRQEVYQSGYNDGYKHGCEDTKKENKKLNDDLGNELAILSAYIISGEWSEAHISRALGIIEELEKFVEE